MSCIYSLLATVYITSSASLQAILIDMCIDDETYAVSNNIMVELTIDNI